MSKWYANGPFSQTGLWPWCSFHCPGPRSTLTMPSFPAHCPLTSCSVKHTWYNILGLTLTSWTDKYCQAFHINYQKWVKKITPKAAQCLVFLFLFIKLMIMICRRQLCMLGWRFPKLFAKEHVSRSRESLYYSSHVVSVGTGVQVHALCLWTAWLTLRTKIIRQNEDASLLRAGTHCCRVHMIMLGLWHCGYEVRPGLWSSGSNTCSASPCMLILHTPAQVEHSSLLMWTSEKNKAPSKASTSDLIDTHTGFIGLWPCVCGLGEVWSTWFMALPHLPTGNV